MVRTIRLVTGRGIEVESSSIRRFYGASFLGHFGGKRQAEDRVFPVANTRGHEPTEPTEPEAETDSRRRARGKIRYKCGNGREEGTDDDGVGLLLLVARESIFLY